VTAGRRSASAWGFGTRGATRGSRLRLTGHLAALVQECVVERLPSQRWSLWQCRHFFASTGMDSLHIVHGFVMASLCAVMTAR